MAASSKRRGKPKRPWQEIAKEAEDHRRVSLEKAIAISPTALKHNWDAQPRCSVDVPGKVLHPKDLQITQMLPEELVRLMASGELSSVDVTTAFLRRAVLAQVLVS